ncbi:ABC transporter ATP-binding protein [Paenibacillus sp. RC67]|uniref:ABC transporter ATP-binding protein n=1 Tax=Paenibacillus sp. RC67 TaxID=3039392 RepID=UPI0024ADF263|nr:ABC transporter ATP-binding protein [Paenibacillus sp. RC67]
MFKQLWLYADRERWKVVIYLILHAFSMLGELGKPYAFAMMINALQKNDPSVVDEVVKWLMFYVLCFFIFEIFHRSARFIERYVAFRNRKRFITIMYDHLHSLPLGWHSDNHSGSVIDRVNRAGNAIHQFSEAQYVFVDFFMKFWGPLIILWTISPTISLIIMGSGILLVFITKKLYGLSVPQYRAQNERLHQLAAALFDYISNIRTIIMLRVGHLARNDIENRINRIFPHLAKENAITHIKCFISGLIMVLLDVGLIFYYIYDQKQAGAAIMIGSVTLIFQYLHQSMASFQFYTGGYESVIHWKTDFEAVKMILDDKEKTQEQKETYLGIWNKLDIESLNFSYGNGKHQLTEISVCLKHDKKIAFVGESGAGKSTLLHLLRGLVPIQQGVLTKDDSKILSFDSLASTTTLLPQEPEIFENTIRYNITMGMPASDAEIDSAIWAAGFSDVVEKLPNGLDSDIREKGVNLSGGQKQRLALARGIFTLRDSSIVLLDEPTSNVDPATEMLIFKRLFERLSAKCMVSVLHRLHLVRYFDYVYVFKQGKIVEEGNFDNLSIANGEFTRLWNNYLAEEETFGKIDYGG